jgi:hypothetical protein
MCAPVAQLDRVFGYEPKGREFESLRAHHTAILIAPVAQLDRASGYEPEGREFESLRAHHTLSSKHLILQTA